MAIISTPTTAGLALEATNRAAGNPTDITGVEVGEGHVTTLALAMARAALVTPFSPVRQTPNPAGVSSGSAIQYAYVDSTLAADYDINEAGLYAGNTMVAYACDDAGAAIGTKPNNASGILPILVAWAGATSIAFSGTFAVVAQGTEDLAGVWEAADATEAADDTNNSRVMTPLRTAARIAAVTLGTLTGLLPVSLGGTGADDAASARANLGVAQGTEDLAGVWEAADATEAADDTNNSRVMTPLRTAARIAAVTPSTVALVDAANIAWDFDQGATATVTIAGNRTLAVPTNGADNVLYLLRATQDATGLRTLMLHGSIDKGSVSDPVLSTGGGSQDLLGFMKWGGEVHYLGLLRGY